MQDRELSVAVAANFTPDLVKPAITHWLGELGIAHRLVLAQYNQVLQELIDEGGLFAGNKAGLNVALVRIGDWARMQLDRDGAPLSTRSQALVGHAHDAVLRRNVRDFIDFATAYARRGGSAPLLVCVCPEPRAVLANPARAAVFAELERAVSLELGALPGVKVVPSAEILATYPVDAYDDADADDLGHIPFTPLFFSALGTLIARRVRAFVSAPHKVLALDCDNTLWTGVVGEDGAEGVLIDAGRRALQDLVVAQHAAGMLICLCSKNVEEDVEEVFRKRKMPLSRRHIVAAKINWRPKSENLRALAEELDLGLDSFVFVDDSRLECAEVRASCPEVLTVEIPPNARDAADVLRNVWAFDRWKVTDEDRRRTELYRQNVAREQSRRDAPSMAEFLDSLRLEIRIDAPTAAQMPRVSQLTFRTNQLNLTTIRRSEAELAELFASQRLECLVTSVSDRFGDYGLVGEVFFEADPSPGGALRVDTLLLSCRVLQRGVEHAMIARLGKIAVARGLSRVDLACNFTAKNQPAQELLRSIGGAHLAPRESGLDVRLPAAEAAALVYVPGAKATPSGDPAEAGERPAKRERASGLPRNAVLEAIAREATSAEAIHVRVDPPKAQKDRPALATEHVSPRDALEHAVAKVAEEVLGVRGLGVNDDLFLDFGADSFAAVRIAAGVRRATSHDVQTAAVLEAKTVSELAKMLRAHADGAGPVSGAARRAPRTIHTLRRDGRKRPLFLARPAGRTAGTLSYAALAKHVDRDRPVHVFQNRPQLERSAPYASVEAMAEEYIAAMREIEPEGPYLLAGWCLGGKTVFEMARRLVDRGQEVGLALLFDTACPGTLQSQLRVRLKRAVMKAGMRVYSRYPALSEALPWLKVARERALVMRFGVLAYWDHENHDPGLVDYAFPGRFDRAELAKMPVDAMWNHVYSVLKAEVDEVEDVEGDGMEIRNGYRYFGWDHVLDALYAPRRPFPGELHLFTTRGANLAPGWQKLCAQPIRVQEFDIRGTKRVPNVHNAMIQEEENIRRFSPALNRLLDACDARANDRPRAAAPAGAAATDAAE